MTQLRQMNRDGIRQPAAWIVLASLVLAAAASLRAAADGQEAAADVAAQTSAAAKKPSNNETMDAQTVRDRLVALGVGATVNVRTTAASRLRGRVESIGGDDVEMRIDGTVQTLRFDHITYVAGSTSRGSPLRSFRASSWAAYWPGGSMPLYTIRE